MEDLAPRAVAAGFVVLLGVVPFLCAFGIARSRRAQRSRSARRMDLARGLGFTFEGAGTSAAAPFQPLLRILEGRALRDAVRGARAGAEVVVADFWLSTAMGDGSHAQRQTTLRTLLLLRADALRAPRCLARPARWFAELERGFGGSSVELSGDGLDQVAVRGDEPEEVRRRWAPAASRFFQRYRSRRPHLEARGRALALSIDAVEDEAEVEAFLAEGIALARALCDGVDTPKLHSGERCAQ
jgi:hypothetical protein